MRHWRMSMRWGTGGKDFFEECFVRGIAALGYYDGVARPVVGDCSRLTPEEFDAAWRAKGSGNSSGQASMRRLAYEVQPGDIIYARSSPHIVARGEVTRGYGFDEHILGGTDCPWEHYIKVDWERLPPFKVAIDPKPVTLMELVGANLRKIDAAAAAAVRSSLPRGGLARTSDQERIATATEDLLAGSQGFGVSPEARRAIELHAMRLATESLEAEGYQVEDVSAFESHDLLCRRGDEVLHVEVKGTQSAGREVILTPSEVAFARRVGPHMALFVVSGIRLSPSGKAMGGSLLTIQPWDVDDGTLRPTGYVYGLPKGRG